jgi:hypothetical protein
MSAYGSVDTTLTRRELLKAGGAAAVAATVPGAAAAQTPKRGGTLRLTVIVDPSASTRTRRSRSPRWSRCPSSTAGSSR